MIRLLILVACIYVATAAATWTVADAANNARPRPEVGLVIIVAGLVILATVFWPSSKKEEPEERRRRWYSDAHKVVRH